MILMSSFAQFGLSIILLDNQRCNLPEHFSSQSEGRDHLKRPVVVDFLQPVTDNSMSPRTQGCITLLPMGTLTGSVKMWCLRNNSTVIRDMALSS